MKKISRGFDVLTERGVRIFLHRLLIYIELKISNVLRILLPATAYWELMRRYHNLKPRDVNAYDSSIDPFEIHWIDPNSIKYRSDRPDRYRHNIHRFCLVGRVSDGDYDLMQGSLADSTFEDRGDYRAFVQRFNEGKAWDEITCISENSKARDTFYDQLYEKISSKGYKSQLQLLNEGKSNISFRYAICNEIAVDIGRDGEPLFVDGSHRLSIAKILDLDKVPVVVYHRHELYMNERERNISKNEMR